MWWKWEWKWGREEKDVREPEPECVVDEYGEEARKREGKGGAVGWVASAESDAHSESTAKSKSVAKPVPEPLAVPCTERERVWVVFSSRADADAK